MIFASIQQLRRIIELVDELDNTFEVVCEYGHERDFAQYTQPIRESAYTALKFRESRLTPVAGDAAGSENGDGQERDAARLNPGR